MARTRKLYVVGYDDDHQAVYGKRERPLGCVDSGVRYANPMTLSQAQRYARGMLSKGAVIYKLVRVRGKERKP